MRLRLRVERNALPAVQTVWPVKDPSSTIASLIQEINAIFPLEGDTWGYEDYAFTLGGYEVLHYHTIKDTLKDEDELIIKPLKWEEVRGRTMTGRDQITVDGRHLLDGVAWGRTALRAPARPDVTIPPRKKRRLRQGLELVNAEDIVNGGNGGAFAVLEEDDGEPQLLLEEAGDDDESDDEPYNPDDEDDSDDSDSTDPDESNSEHQAVDATMKLRPAKQRRGSWHSHASSTTSSNKSDSSSSSGSSSSSSDGDSDSDSDSSDSSSDSSSESDEEDSWEGITKNDAPAPASKTKEATREADTPPKQKSPPKTNGTSKSKKQASRDEASTETFVGVPNGGAPGTKARNIRRRDAKRLKYAKEAGEVPQDMTLAQWKELMGNGDLTAGDQGGEDGGAQVNEANATANASAEDIPQAAETIETAADQAPSKNRKRTNRDDVIAETADSFEQRRQQLLKAINSGGIDVNDNLDGIHNDADAPEELSSKNQSAEEAAAAAEAIRMAPPPSANTRRAKLDLAGTQRLLFGSLGVRRPKTQAEKEALQKKLAEKSTRKPVQRPEVTEAKDESSVTLSAGTKATETPEAWHDKINLTAVECVDENVTLSEPPFPFHQRWDPQYNRKGKKRASSTYMDHGGGKKRKRGNAQTIEEQYDKYNTDGYGDALNYDEEDEDEYWEDGALLGDDEEEVEEGLEDLPDLPADITALPLLASPDEAKVDDVITFTELACDESTGWQPKMTARTAKVLEPAATKEGSCRLQLSYRDVKPPSYDEEGNRVYSKFEMPKGGDEEDGDAEERVREVAWGTLGEVRAVRKAGLGTPSQE